MTNIQTVLELASTYETDDMDATNAAKLRALATMQTDLEAAIFETVRAARSMGDSWQQIGNALGVSKQAAQKRWAHCV